MSTVTHAKEAAVVGVATAMVGLLVSTVWMYIQEKKLPSARIQLSVLGSLFITGVLVHLLFEVSGANKWYCKHGAACK